MKGQIYDAVIPAEIPDAFVQLFSSYLSDTQQHPEKRHKPNKKSTPYLNVDDAERLLPGYLTVARFTLRLAFEVPSTYAPDPSDGPEFNSGTSVPVAVRVISRARSHAPAIAFTFDTESHRVTAEPVGTSSDWYPVVAFGAFPSIYKGSAPRTYCSRSVLKKASDDDSSFIVETDLLWRDSMEIPQRVSGSAFGMLLQRFGNMLPPVELMASSSPAVFYNSVHVPPKSVLLPSVSGLDELATDLFPFQRRAVRWLLEREGLDVSWNGELSYKPNVDSYIPPTFIETTDEDGKICHFSPVLQVMTSNISGWNYRERALRGGILAEEMGLGKTVEMLALISSHRRPSITNGYASHGPPGLLESSATLIITPPAILEQWKEEISTHAPNLKFVHYRGINDTRRTDDSLIEELMSHDIVLTTYNVLQKEIYYAEDPPERALRHAKKIPRRKSPLVQISWWRVAIDEAQMIETGVSNAARVAKVIPRCNAWAMSGTPLKGDMKDIFGLLSFLRYEPFCYSMDTWVRLFEYFHSDFKKIIGTLVLRHNKNIVRDELHIPRQKRVVITVPFTAVEEQRYGELFDQMADECGLDATGGPLTDDWDPSSRLVIDRMRSWLVKLRQACLHLEIGYGPRRLFKGGGPLRSVSDVLEVMIDQNETEIRTEERARLHSQIRRGQIFENALKPEKSLEIWLDTLASAQLAVKGCREQYEEELKRHTERQQENEHASDDDADNDEQEDELNGRLGHRRLLLRAALEIEHMCEFFIASARYQIKTNEERTVPDSEEFLKLENLEEQGYQRAKIIRREMLSDSHKKVSKHIDRLKAQTEKHGLVEIPQLLAPEETGGIESRRMLDRLEDLYEAINDHTKTFNEWRQHMLKLLLKPLVDEEDDAELQGDEYESSTKHQDELYVYMEGLRVMFAQHFDAVTGQQNTLIQHEVRQALSRAELQEGPAPELYISLMKKCKGLKPERRLGSVRGLVNELRNLTVSLDRQDIKGSSRARAELSMMEDLLHQASRMSAAQSKAITALEREMDRFRAVMNNRLEHYRQLQSISDTVAPYQEEKREGQPVDEHETRIANELRIDAKLSTLRSKRRYLIHLRDESGAEEAVKVCVICQSSFDIGVLTVCGHKYCKLCFIHWWQQHRNCPVCKGALGQRDFHQITYKPQEIVAQEETSQPTGEEAGGTAHSNAIYSDISSGTMKEIQDIDINGSYGTKIDTLARHLLWLREHDPGAKSIVFSQYKPFLEILGRAFGRFKIGFTTVDTKDGIERFKKDDSKECFLLHARAHSSGLNLVNATHVFLCEPLVNTAIELQAIARVHRIGQNRETTVWMYLVAGTVEESIYQLSVSRRLAHIAQKHRELETQWGSPASSSGGSSFSSKDDSSGFDLKDLSENIIDAANNLEVEEGALGRVLEGRGEGERVDDTDLWQCLFGKGRKGIGSSSVATGAESNISEQLENEVEHEVGRVLRAEAASSRRNR